MSEDELEFMFEGMAVGVFEGAEFPRADGRYRYMPYRGLGHYRMQTTLETSGPARCYYQSGAQRVSFQVLDCPEYGTLVLSGFETSPAAEHPER